MFKNISQALCLSILMLAGLMGTYTAPVLIGVFVDVLGFSEFDAGNLVAIEISSIALSAIFTSLFINRWPVKRVALAGILLLSLGELISAMVTQYSLLAIVRGVVGVSSGVLLALVNTVIARSGNPEKLYGQTLAYTSLGFACLLFVLPYALSVGHLSGLYGVLALTAWLGILPVALQREIIVASDEGVGSELAEIDFKPVCLFFAIVTVLYLVMGGTWAFTERIAKNINIESGAVGMLLGLSTVAGILGASAAASLNVRLGRILPTVIGFVVSGISCLLIIVSANVVIFTVGVLFYGFIYMFTVSYVLGIGAALDSMGRVAAATNGYLLVPYSLGPVVFGYLGTNSLQTLWYAPLIICVVSALLIYLVLHTLAEEHKQDFA